MVIQNGSGINYLLFKKNKEEEDFFWLRMFNLLQWGGTVEISVSVVAN